MTTHNQEWVLSKRRAEESANDPAFYSTREWKHGRLIWMNICGNVGWYWPEIEAGTLKDMHAIAFGGHDSLIKLLSPKQRAKILAAYA